MRDENRELLEDVIGIALEDAKLAAPGSEERSKSVAQVTNLLKEFNSIEKTDLEFKKSQDLLDFEGAKFEMQQEQEMKKLKMQHDFEREKQLKQQEFEKGNLEEQREFDKEKFAKQQELEEKKFTEDLEVKKDSDKKYRWLQIGLAVGSAICGGIFAMYQRDTMREHQKWEEEGHTNSYTSSRSLTRDLFRLKRK